MKATFTLEAVLSSIYGTLLCPIGDVYLVLQFVTGDDALFTHQLPKAGEWARPVIEAQHPFLKEINLDGINPENWKERLAEIKAKYPNMIEIQQADGWQGITRGIIGDLEEIMNKP